jgi:hypothetical protein
MSLFVCNGSELAVLVRAAAVLTAYTIRLPQASYNHSAPQEARMAHQGGPPGEDQQAPPVEDQEVQSAPLVKVVGWLSDADKRTLVVTFAGTLAANLLTVLVVGGAIAIIHYSESAEPPRDHGLIVLFLALTSVILVFFYAVLALFARAFAKRKPASQLRRFLYTFAPFYVGIPLIGLFLVLVGAAAGIK